MKQLGTIGLAFAIAGNLLGAGFVSGQELWQYFGVFGKNAFFGMILGFFVLYLVTVMLLRYAQREEISEVDALIIRRQSPLLRMLVGAVTMFFMFCTYVVMAAGAGSLTEQAFSVPHYIGSGLLCLAVALVTLSGVSGFLRVFSLFVPVILIFIFGLCVFTSPRFTLEELERIEGAGDNPMLSNWALSALNNATYNAGCSLGVFSVMAGRIKNKRTLYLGVLLGTVILMAISAVIIVMMFSSLDVVSFSLPMVAYAAKTDARTGLVFSLLLLCAMFATSVATSVAIAYYLRAKVRIAQRRGTYIIFVTVISVVAFAGSLAGFSELVSVVYPISGYIGFLFVALVAYNYLHSVLKSKKQNNKKEQL